MHLWTRPLGPLQTNGYVLSTKDKEAIVIDPGMEPQPMLDYIKDYRVIGILLTHAHFDHIGGLEEVRQATGAPVYIHDLEAEWLLDPEKNGSARWPAAMEPLRCQPRDKALSEGELQLGHFTLQVLHTPGHSPGSVSFYIPEKGWLIAGDTLFAGSIGRTDLPGGNHEALINAIKEKLFSLPDDTKVFPGHGPETVIGDEKRYNPFVGGI